VGFGLPALLGLTGPQILLAVGVVLVGACLQGALGFGLGLVSAPVLVMLNPDLVPGALLAMGVPLAFSMAWRERADLDLKSVRWAIAGRVPGTIVGSLSVALLSRQALSIGFGVVILGAVAVSLIGLAVVPTRTNLFIAGVASGITGTATSVGGPPIALVYQQMTGPQVRAALSAYMVAGSIGSLLALAAVGELEVSDLVIALSLSPVVMAGFGLSRRAISVVDRGFTRPAVLGFAALSGCSIIIRTLV